MSSTGSDPLPSVSLPAATNALSLSWSFGFNCDLPNGVYNLSDEKLGSHSIFYVSAHTGVLYNYLTRKQTLLQGHCNPITACCISEDKRFVITADSGPDSLIVIWDALTGKPIKDIPLPHTNGVKAMDLSPDAMFLVTLSEPLVAANEDASATSEFDEGKREESKEAESGTLQDIALWEWTSDRKGPLYSETFDTKEDFQKAIRFNRSDIKQIVSNGDKRVIFWSWERKKFTFYSPIISTYDFKQKVAPLTQSMFIPDSTQAITATLDGDLVLWDRSLIGLNEGYTRNTDRRAIKLIRLTSRKKAIRCLQIFEDKLVTGSDDGAVRFYDFQFRILAWFEDLDAGPVTSVSFANTTPEPHPDPDGFNCSDFIVGTKNALIVGASADLFEKSQKDERRGVILVQGFDSPVSAIATHPKESLIACGSDSGKIQLWDYEKKHLKMVRNFGKKKIEEEEDEEEDEGIQNKNKNKKKKKAKKHDFDDDDQEEQMELAPRCMKYDPSGKYLAIGCRCGTIKILNGDTQLSDLPLNSRSVFTVAEGEITHICFSACSQFLATADTDLCVSLFRHMAKRPLTADDNEEDDEIIDYYEGEMVDYHAAERGHAIVSLRSASEEKQLDINATINVNLQRADVQPGDVVRVNVTAQTVERLGRCDAHKAAEGNQNDDYVPLPQGAIHRSKSSRGPGWVFIGKYRSHNDEISGLEFGVDMSGASRLMSVSKDRTLVEYDVEMSSIAEGVKLFGEPKRIEQSAKPLACLFYPYMSSKKEDIILTANDMYKFKLLNAMQKTCRKTVLSPTYGPPVSKMIILPEGASSSDGTFMAYATDFKVIGLVKLPMDGNPYRSMGLVAHPNKVVDLAASYDGQWLATCGGDDRTVNMWAVDTIAIDHSLENITRGLAPFEELLEGGRDGEFYKEIVDYFYYAQLRSQKGGEQATGEREATGLIPITEIPYIMRALGYYPTQQEIKDIVSEVHYSRFVETGQPVNEINFEDFIKLYVNHRPVFGYNRDQIEDAFRKIAGKRRGTDKVQFRAFLKYLRENGENMDKKEIQRYLEILLPGEYEMFMAQSHISSSDFLDVVLAAAEDEQGEDGEQVEGKDEN